MLFALDLHAADPRVLRVAAAANIRDPLTAIARQFEARHPGVRVELSFASSGSIFSQIANGAPFDLFLSADTGYPDRLHRQGLTAGAPFDYAIGRVVLWVRRDLELEPSNGPSLLLDPRIRKIAVANPRLAPYGAAAMESLSSRHLLERVRDKMVYGENVVQAAQYLDVGAAEAGIIALSLALAPSMREKGSFWIIPDGWHAPIRQAGVVLPGPNRELAEQFRICLSSGAAADVLSRYGYLAPAASKAGGGP